MKRFMFYKNIAFLINDSLMKHSSYKLLEASGISQTDWSKPLRLKPAAKVARVNGSQPRVPMILDGRQKGFRSAVRPDRVRSKISRADGGRLLDDSDALRKDPAQASLARGRYQRSEPGWSAANY